MLDRQRLAIALLGLMAWVHVGARITKNTIAPIVAMGDVGRQLVVTGPLECTAGERAHVIVTLTQRTTGAIAEGRGFVACTGREETWAIEALVQGKSTFEPGPATAAAIVWTVARGDTTDAHQWLVPVTLV